MLYHILTHIIQKTKTKENMHEAWSFQFGSKVCKVHDKSFMLNILSFSLSLSLSLHKICI